MRPAAPRPLAFAAGLAGLAGPIASLGLSGCGEELGGVEFSWAFLDQDLGTVYPRGDAADSCRMVGRRGQELVEYDLNVRLRVMENCGAAAAEGTDGPACDVVIEETFGCNRFRGYLPEVPTDIDPYLMQVQVRINARGTAPFTPGSTCIAVPGPRERTIRAGHVTDLAVYQLVIDASRFDDAGASDDHLDLEACAE